MSIGISADHAELAATLRKWGASIDPVDLIRAAEEDATAGFASAWEACLEMGLPGIAVPESLDGGGGTVLDAAVALEAAAYALVPGALLGAQVAALVLGAHPLAGRVATGDVVVGVAPRATLDVSGDRLQGTVVGAWDAPVATHFLLGSTDGRWFVAARDQVAVNVGIGPDLSRRWGTVVVDLALADVEETGIDATRVERAVVTLAAAEAAGLARWCLDTAVEYAGVREQFGRKIGSFQAIKHLCAEMLETAETITALAWDAAAAAEASDAQWAFSVEAAATSAFSGAVEVAQACIQVLGGIGFTFEHEAHFRLRRAYALRAAVGDQDAWAARLAASAAAGTRRRVEIDFEGADAVFRTTARGVVATILAATDQRAELVTSGYLTPHWPAPHGLSASALEQLVIDQELTAAGVVRPDLKIAGWAVPTIIAHGSDAQREQFVQPGLAGDIKWCQLFSEPGAGSDLASLRTRAERVDGGWKLTGQKVWTSLAQDAEWGICLARTDADVPQHKGITYFLVDMTSAGLDIRPLREMTGDALFNEVFLDNVFVPDAMVVGEPGDGWKLARTTLANERVAMASHKLDSSVELAVSLLAEGGLGLAAPIQIGHAVALSTTCSLLGVRSTLRSLAGQGPGAESSVSKLLGVRNRQDASDLAVRLLGDRVLTGAPETAEALHEALLTRCLSIAGGTTQILRNVAGERILGLPR